MKNQLLKIFSLLLISMNSIGQDSLLLNCLSHEETYDNLRANLCSDNKPQNNSLLYQNIYAQMSHWIPDSNFEKLNVRVAFHIFNDNNGQGTNYPENQNTIDQVNQMISWVNGLYGNCTPTNPISGVQDIDYTKIEFELSDRIYFYENSNLNDCNVSLKFQYLEQNHPERLIYLPIFVGGNCGGFANLPYPDFIPETSGLTAPNIEGDSFSFISGIGWSGAQTLSHELGHNLDLKHTYEPSCCHESCDHNSFDYLWDVFGSNVQESCWHDGGWSCDIGSSDNTCTNNIMGGVNQTCKYFSPLQVGKIQRALSLKSVRKYVDPNSKISIPYIITANENWDFDIRLHRDLIIETGAELTISCRLIMGNNCKIVVKPGGRLIIDGGIVTNPLYSDTFWHGIEVWGNSQATQLTSNQGFLQLKNGAIIENARTAIRVWKPNDWNSTGGIVLAYNSTFKNNWRSVEYISYHNFNLSNTELINRGLFSNCEFIWDDDYENISGTDINPAITMYDIYGVRIQGCDFIDSRTYITNYNDRPIGILSVDAGYRVIGRNLNIGVPSNHIEYDETGYDVGQFINLREGIRATNSNSQAHVIVDHCKFLNSNFGVILRGVDNSMITRNLFNYTAGHTNDITSMLQLGIIQATDYTVEGNHFMNEVNGASVVGGLMSNTGIEQNEIYKNKYDGVYTGNFAIGKNTNDLSGVNSASGLQWKCNEYNNFIYDQYVTSIFSNEGDGNGIRLKQGVHNEPAGNIFTAGFDSQQSEFHFATNDQDNLIYYAFNNQPEIPTEISGNVGVLIVNLINNECESNFNTVITGVTGKLLNNVTKQSLRDDFTAIDAELSHKIAELDSLVDAANPSSLYAMVDNLQASNKQQLRAALEAASPYLTPELLMYVGNKTNPEYPPSWFKDLILMNIEVAQSNTFMNYLKTKNSPMPHGLYNQIDNVRNQSITERGEKLNEIISLDTQKSRIIRLLITNELSDTTEIDWASYNEFVTLRKDLFCRAQHADEFFGRREVQLCDTKLDEIHNNLSDYLIASTQQEMEDFYTFKKYIISISNTSGVLEGLTEDQVDDLLVFSEELTGRAQVQAQNLLCFFAGICDELFVEYDATIKSMSHGSENKTNIIFEQSNNIKVVPNPNHGEFVIELKQDDEISNIEMFGLDGKVLLFESENSNPSTSTILIKRPVTGVYWIKVTTKNGDHYTTKFVIK